MACAEEPCPCAEEPYPCAEEPYPCFSAFCMAVADENFDEIEWYLDQELVDPSHNNNEALAVAAESGNMHVFNILLSDARVSLSFRQAESVLFAAAKYGHCDIVQCIIDDMRTDIAADNHRAIKLAAKYGHLDVVDALSRATFVDDPRIDTVGVCSAFAVACAYGQTHVAQAIADRGVLSFAGSDTQHPPDPAPSSSSNTDGHVGDGGVGTECTECADASVVWPCSHKEEQDVFVNFSERLFVHQAMVGAARNGHLDGLKKLAEHAGDRFDPAWCACEAIARAGIGGYARIVDFLMGRLRDPGPHATSVLKLAATHGSVGVVAAMLAHPGVDPAADNNAALREAMVHGHADVVRLLAEDARVDMMMCEFPIKFKADSDDEESVYICEQYKAEEYDVIGESTRLLLHCDQAIATQPTDMVLLFAASASNSFEMDRILPNGFSPQTIGLRSLVSLMFISMRRSHTRLFIESLREIVRVKETMGDDEDDFGFSSEAVFIANFRGALYEGIDRAMEAGYLDIIYALLGEMKSHARIDAHVDEITVAWSSVGYDRADVMETLVAGDGPIDPTFDDNALARMAISRGKTKVADLLMSDVRVIKHFDELQSGAAEFCCMRCCTEKWSFKHQYVVCDHWVDRPPDEWSACEYIQIG